MTELQKEFTKARLSKDMIKMSRISNEMMEIQNREGFSMFKTMKPMILQIPIFLSVFNGLRGIANLPVDSFKTGGLLWFADFTIPDPYFVLPAIAMGSMLFMFEFGVDASTQALSPTIRWFMRGFPIVGFFFILNTPSAIVWYWATSNFISIIQSFSLRAPAVKKMFKLPDPPKTNFTREKTEGPLKAFRENMANARLMAEIENRERMDASNWQKSGIGPVPKTFAHNPLSSDPKVSKRVIKIVRKAEEELKKTSG
ncbi:hypothetical protein Ciccas_006451 [Cichlidogyrus casuarinus]|uniref:Membrane insertase YidC/Oxa/ALB C-terminal domain-containing protein n=1 Tax=Cichlidogyrus casuarinus TaxID=1844966 RepID=A0ABD2Q5R9_9PLAT